MPNAANLPLATRSHLHPRTRSRRSQRSQYSYLPSPMLILVAYSYSESKSESESDSSPPKPEPSRAGNLKNLLQSIPRYIQHPFFFQLTAALLFQFPLPLPFPLSTLITLISLCYLTTVPMLILAKYIDRLSEYLALRGIPAGKERDAARAQHRRALAALHSDMERRIYEWPRRMFSRGPAMQDSRADSSPPPPPPSLPRLVYNDDDASYVSASAATPHYADVARRKRIMGLIRAD
ncbi:hypothetical protein JR316_0005250 [Psilocybe cubensis]|uniref:Uncharacterized protein n=2 Tax=Psilocybe cubensis TaxID=181762 RepID=A0A8H8CLF6_PSICU|nr:hypothetical protein JR316_0005250 [Psilocybe cubensis]KAH9483147.1 hypothetical protein JR316_0005250 [Psilocybe cubensis]